jgi:hypothetical protein
MIPRITTFEFEYLGKFEIEIKNILEHESGAHMGLIHEKNPRQKISCYCTFNLKASLCFLADVTRKPVYARECATYRSSAGSAYTSPTVPWRISPALQLYRAR